MAFVGNRKTQQWVVVDGRETERHASISWPVSVSDNGEGIAYAASEGTGTYVVAHGRRGPTFEFVSLPILSQDGRVVAYMARDGDEEFVMVNNIRGKTYDFVSPPVMSKDGKNIAYAAAGDFVVYNGHEIGPFQATSLPALSSDGMTLAYGAKREGQWFLVKGDRSEGIQDWIHSTFISPDGEKAGYITHGPEGWYVVVDGEKRGSYAHVNDAGLSPHSHVLTLALTDTDGLSYVLAGPKESEHYDGLGPLEFSKDGSGVSFGAWRKGRIYWVKMDFE